MENMSRALEIGFGVLVFVIGLTIVFSMFSQAKQTADVVFEIHDEAKYLTDADELEGLTYYLSKQNSTDNSLVTRTVGWETVIPTVYRYGIEQYGVTILDENRNIVARYDIDTESVMGNWYSNKGNTVAKQYNTNLFNYLTTKVYAGFDVEGLDNEEELEKIFEKIYKIERASSNETKFSNPWLRDTYSTKPRLDADFSSKSEEKVDFGAITYDGRCLRHNKENQKFNEYFNIIKTTDEQGVENSKIEIIYIMIN